MKTILFWKYADIAGQALMLFPLIFIVSPDTREKALLAYFTVGGWQAVSCAATALADVRPVDDSRGHYNRMLAWTLGIFAVSALVFLATDGGHALNIIHAVAACIALLEALTMLILGPIMACWYAGITLAEIALLRQAIHHRSEVHWKL